MASSDAEHWTRGYVTWGQLLGSMAAISFALGSAFITLLITQEARITRLEERQNFNARGLAEHQIVMDRSQLVQDQRFEALRTEIMRKLETIGADVVILRITFAKQEAKR